MWVAAAVVVVAGGGSCSWRPAGFATGFAALERSIRKARSWAVSALDSLLATSALGHTARKPDIGLVPEPGHN